MSGTAGKVDSDLPIHYYHSMYDPGHAANVNRWKKDPPGRERPERLTLLLLLIALSTLFLCSVDKGYFYRPFQHNWDTAKNLAIAENLSPDHYFRLFLARRQGSDGAPTYQMYSRFPVGGYALIKLAILPFGNDLSAKILAARMLMLLLFSAAAVLAFHSLVRITSRRWVALAAALMAFSSYYMLFYGDAVSNEISVDLFAVLLAFHGMVVFVQEGRFRQLLAKTFVALLLGWHVYAFLLPFVILGLAHEAVWAWKDGTALWPRVRSTGAAVLRSRYTALGLAALLFGAAVLSFNFANEYAASRGETPVTELLSFQSMLDRTGITKDYWSPMEWLGFLRQQFFRVYTASVPFMLTDWGADLPGLSPPPYPSAPSLSGPELSVYLLLLLMAVVASTTVVRLARPLLTRRHRLLLATLALSGFFWALPMRWNTLELRHNHEAMFYVGVPLVFYSLLLLYVHRRRGRGPVVGVAFAALLAFVVSAFEMERRRRPEAARTAEIQRTAMAELGAIRETTRGKAVLVLGSVEPEWSWQVLEQAHPWRYYLAGRVLARSLDVEAAARAADFIVALDRVESEVLLTPGNERVFLYGSAGIDDLVGLYRATYQRVVSGEPAARSWFDVYLGDRALFHVKDPCASKDVGLRSIAKFIPEDPKDLPERRRRRREILRIPSQQSNMLFEGKCIAIISLPDYPVSSILTGRSFASKGPRNWRAEIPASQ